MLDGVDPAVEQDQPSNAPSVDLNAVLAARGVPRSIPDELTEFARRTGLRLEEPGGEPVVTDPPEGEEPEDPEGEGEQQEEPSVTLDDFDPDQIPDDADREWFQERVKAFQGDYTRKTQEAAEIRRAAEDAGAIIDGLRNPETAAEFMQILGLNREQILDALGLELEGAGGDDEIVDPDERIDRLEARQAQEANERAAAEREDREADHIESAIGKLEKDEDREFDGEEVSLITTYSRVHPLPSGAPDVQGAYDHLKRVLERRQQEWVESKKQRTRKPNNGVPAVKLADLKTEEGRMKAAEAASRAARASQD